MKRLLFVFSLPLALLSLTAFFEGDVQREPVFKRDDCIIIDLADADTGKPIVGIEDIAMTEDGQALILSAYDRLSAETASRLETSLPNGGLYRFPLEEVSEKPLRLSNLVDLNAVKGLRPHGITINTNQLAVINRRGGRQRSLSGRRDLRYFNNSLSVAQ